MNLDKLTLMRMAPRCSARSKRTGKTCRAPAVRGKAVCRLHGARAGAPSGARNGSYRHGYCTAAARAERDAGSVVLRDARQLLASLGMDRSVCMTLGAPACQEIEPQTTREGAEYRRQ